MKSENGQRKTTTTTSLFAGVPAAAPVYVAPPHAMEGVDVASPVADIPPVATITKLPVANFFSLPIP